MLDVTGGRDEISRIGGLYHSIYKGTFLHAIVAHLTVVQGLTDLFSPCVRLVSVFAH